MGRGVVFENFFCFLVNFLDLRTVKEGCTFKQSLLWFKKVFRATNVVATAISWLLLLFSILKIVKPYCKTK
jgi:hypothetical protein